MRHALLLQEDNLIAHLAYTKYDHQVNVLSSPDESRAGSLFQRDGTWTKNPIQGARDSQCLPARRDAPVWSVTPIHGFWLRFPALPTQRSLPSHWGRWICTRLVSEGEYTDLSIGWPPQVFLQSKDTYKKGMPTRHYVEEECVGHSERRWLTAIFILSSLVLISKLIPAAKFFSAALLWRGFWT